MGTRRSVASLTPQRIQEISERDDAVVMQAVHDNVFDPWATDELSAIMDGLIRHTTNNRSKGVAVIRDEARGAYADFARLHPVFFEKLTDPEVASNEEHVKVLRFMLTTQRRMACGSISKEEAMKQVADTALVSLAQQAAAAKREA